MFPLGSSYFVFVFLSLWCLWWEVWDNCIDSRSLPSFLFLFLLVSGKGCGPGVTLCCFVVYCTRRFVVCFSVCHFVLVFFSPFSIAITSLGEERASLSAFRTFVRFVLVWICRFPLPLGVWEGLRFVIVTLPGLFSYLFLWLLHSPYLFVYVVFVLSLFVPHFSFIWCLWRAVGRDCGISWVSSLIFFFKSPLNPFLCFFTVFRLYVF